MARHISDDERDDIDSLHADVISNESVIKLVFKQVVELCESDDPVVHEADVWAARRYLLRCMENMSEYERKSSDYAEFAGLWARGAIGAARYRARRASKGTR